MASSTDIARLEARISRDSHALLKRAAEIQGRTLTDFVVSVAQEAAQRVIEESDVLKLSLKDQGQFAAMILNPAEPNDALVRAFEHRRELIK